MKIEEIKKTVEDFFNKNINPPYKMTSIISKEDGWQVEVEVIEESEYMKRYGKDQLLGVYQVILNEDMEITSYDRMALRPRSTPLVTEEGR